MVSSLVKRYVSSRPGELVGPGRYPDSGWPCCGPFASEPRGMREAGEQAPISRQRARRSGDQPGGHDLIQSSALSQHFSPQHPSDLAQGQYGALHLAFPVAPRPTEISRPDLHAAPGQSGVPLVNPITTDGTIPHGACTSSEKQVPREAAVRLQARATADPAAISSGLVRHTHAAPPLAAMVAATMRGEPWRGPPV